MQLTRRLLKVVRAHPRLLLATAVGVGVALVLPSIWPARAVTRWIVAWNVGAWLYLALVGWMMARSDRAQLQRRSQGEDEGARTILALVALASLASLGAIVAELAQAKDLVGTARLLHVGLAVVTIVSSWAFTQVMFALHYAHQFHVAVARGQDGGLQFPGTASPDYMDFVYFSVVIGTSGQTADVSFVSPAMRRVGTVHCALAFIFNTSLIGLMINVASSLV